MNILVLRFINHWLYRYHWWLYVLSDHAVEPVREMPVSVPVLNTKNSGAPPKPILSFLHPFSSKSACVGGWRPQRELPTNLKSWISPWIWSLRPRHSKTYHRYYATDANNILTKHLINFICCFSLLQYQHAETPDHPDATTSNSRRTSTLNWSTQLNCGSTNSRTQDQIGTTPSSSRSWTDTSTSPTDTNPGCTDTKLKSRGAGSSSRCDIWSEDGYDDPAPTMGL